MKNKYQGFLAGTVILADKTVTVQENSLIIESIDAEVTHHPELGKYMTSQQVMGELRDCYQHCVARCLEAGKTLPLGHLISCIEVFKIGELFSAAIQYDAMPPMPFMNIRLINIFKRDEIPNDVLDLLNKYTEAKKDINESKS